MLQKATASLNLSAKITETVWPEDGLENGGLLVVTHQS